MYIYIYIYISREKEKVFAISHNIIILHTVGPENKVGPGSRTGLRIGWPQE